MQAVHKQASLCKELKQLFNQMFADPRIKKETGRYEGFLRQRNSVVGKYRKVRPNVVEAGVFGLTNSLPRSGKPTRISKQVSIAHGNSTQKCKRLVRA